MGRESTGLRGPSQKAVDAFLNKLFRGCTVRLFDEQGREYENEGDCRRLRVSECSKVINEQGEIIISAKWHRNLNASPNRPIFGAGLFSKDDKAICGPTPMITPITLDRFEADLTVTDVITNFMDGDPSTASLDQIIQDAIEGKNP